MGLRSIPSMYFETRVLIARGGVRICRACLGDPPAVDVHQADDVVSQPGGLLLHELEDRKSTRLNSSHLVISYAVFCLKKKIKQCMTVSAAQLHCTAAQIAA